MTLYLSILLLFIILRDWVYVKKTHLKDSSVEIISNV